MKLVVRFAALLFCAILLVTNLSHAESDYTIKFSTGYFEPAPLAAPSALAASSMADKHLLLQFEQPLTDADRARLEAEGIELLQYVPNNTWIVRLSSPLSTSAYQSNDIRWMGTIEPQQKVARQIAEGRIPESARRGGNLVQFAVVVHADEDPNAWAEQFRTQYGAEIIGVEPFARIIDLIMPEGSFASMAEIDAVQWIEPALPVPQEHNNGCRDNMGVTVVQNAPYSLTGEYVMVAQWDGGRASSTHDDFSGRLQTLDNSPVSGHATHVAGTIIGDGTRSGGTYRGMAPLANLVSQLWWSSASEASSEYQTVISTYGANVSNNSWGYGPGSVTQQNCDDLLGNYFTVNGTLDNIVRGAGSAPISIVWSAGNDRGTSSDYCGSIGWTFNTISPPGTAKNIVTVGAINSNNSSMTSFSSWGPCDDGRLKPDVVGPGCQSTGDFGVTSTSTTNGYAVSCGTSMAAPAVTGLIALLYQQYFLTNGVFVGILPSTIKGILVNSATDLGNVGPDYKYGHGRVDAEKAVKKIQIGTPSWVQGQLSTGQSLEYELLIPGGTSKLRVSLAWDDAGGTAVSGSALINDLDLVLEDPFGAETNPWILNPASPNSNATRGIDRVNNVETAEVTNPAAGIWRARVTGFNIPQGPQNFSLVFTPDSIHQPGSTMASAVYDEGNQVVAPGVTTPVNFWVTNIGATADSIRIRIADNNGWLLSTLDTMVFLSPFDSAYVSVQATVPAAALANDSTVVTCQSNFQSDTLRGSDGSTKVSAAAVYALALADIAPDTVFSPDTYPVSFKVHNLSNATSNITIQPSSADGWLTQPTQRAIGVAARDSGVVSFDVIVPAEEIHNTLHEVVFAALGTGGVVDTTILTVTIRNPLAPPTLISPDTVVYTQNGIVSFQWTDVGDTYRLIIGANPQLSSVIASYPGLTTASFTLPAVDSLNDGQYFWGVKVYAGADSSSLQQNSRRLVIDNGAPLAQTTYFPSPGVILANKAFSFSYSAASSALPGTAPEASSIQVAFDSLFSNVHMTIPSISGTSAQPTDTLPEGRWYWRVLRTDLAGNSTASASAPTFIMDTRPPSVPIQIYPANLANVKTNPVPIRWDGTPPSGVETSDEYYYLHVSTSADFTDAVYSGFLPEDSLLIAEPPLTRGTTYYWRVKAIDSAGFYTAYTGTRSFKYQPFICGDVNNSGSIPDLPDLSLLIAYLTTGQVVLPVPAAASLDCNTLVDLADLSRLIAYLTVGNIPLCCP